MSDKRLMAVAKAIREEIVRQYRDDERGKCPLGVPFYEEDVAPMLIAEAAVKAYERSQYAETSAKDVYAIFRGSLRSGEVKLFPHAWDGLPQHYRDLLCFVVAHARGGL